MNLLEHIADRLLKEGSQDLGNWTIIFPNKRAGLFFKKIISQQIEKPIWSPNILSINELFERLCPYENADKFSLIYRLYQAIEKHFLEKETFEQFFFWGETLLADFDELDNFLIDSELLFQDLNNIKNLESSLEHLNEQQKELIKRYWKSFEGVLTREKEKSLSIWRVLGNVYQEFNEDLQRRRKAYPGMIHRWVVENLESGIDVPYQKIIFAGFNALTKSEDNLISWCCQNLTCKVFWDADDYYLNNDQQEAGQFLRDYKRKHSILSPTFRDQYQSDSFSDRSIKVIECSSDAGQAQETGRYLQELLNAGTDPEKIAIVLPNERLLIPVMNAVPQEVESLNVTMGYPLQNSLAYSFLIALIELQMEVETKKPIAFYYKNVLKILSHPFIHQNPDGMAKEIIQKIKKDNILFPDIEILDEGNDWLKIIFQKIHGSVALIDYLQECMMLIVNELDEANIESEFILHFYRILNNLKDLYETHSIDVDQRSFLRLLNHAIFRERLPFEGEPLKGLQIMGFMETRNLSFDHVFLLSTNEGILPPGRHDVSFIPYSIRKAYGLPTVDHMDSIFAYLFYRLVHNSTNLTVLFNGNSEKGNTGEVSRFIKQLASESQIDIQYSSQELNIFSAQSTGIEIDKTPEIMERLNRYLVINEKPEKRLSPSALSTYIDCSLRFYYRYVLDLYEDDEVEEDIGNRELGLIFHRVAELIYQQFDVKGKRMVKTEDILKIEKCVDQFIETAFREQFGSGKTKKLHLNGRQEFVYGIVKQLILRVLEIDKSHTPFEIVGLEANEEKGYKLDFGVLLGDKKISVGLKGIIDRIDKKNNTVRIIDYKTGKDTREFKNIPSLFNSEDKGRNKAIFQTFLYALLFLNANSEYSNPLQAGLFNLKDLFGENFDVLIQNKQSNKGFLVTDVKPFLEEYKIELSNLLKDIFGHNIGFVQTNDKNRCKYCPYNILCNRDD